MSQPACSTCGTATRPGTGGLCPACLIRLALDPSAAVPDYQVVSPLGSGPSGMTYAAQEIGANRLLAVKVLAPSASPLDDVSLESLREKVTGFRHDCVAQTHGIERSDSGELRLVRDFIKGKPLPAWLAQATPETKARAYHRIAETVRDMHDAGLAHGHLAPPNIIMEIDDMPVIVDLGAAAAGGSIEALRQRDEQDLRVIALVMLPEIE